LKEACSAEPKGVEEAVSKLLVKLGYTVSSVNVSGKCVTFKAKAVHGGIEESTLVVAYSKKAKVGDPALKEVMKDVSEQRFSRTLVFSMSSFTDKAVAYAQDKPIELVDVLEYERLLVKHGLAVGKVEGKDMFVYEYAFKPGVSVEDARRVFESQRKKSFLFFGKPSETLSEVEGKLAPAVKVTALLNGGKKNFFVNLHDGRLHYVRRDVLKKQLVLEGERFLDLIFELDDEMLSVLGEVVCQGQIPLSTVGSSGNLGIQDKLRLALRLKSRKLIDVLDKGEPVLISNVDLPDFREDRFDLERFYGAAGRLETLFSSDGMKYDSGEVARKLSLFFGGDAVLEKVVYLPYFRGVFVDSRSRVRYGLLSGLKENA
jgi:hypothetical protein